jgi:hypothetical protein
LDTFWFHRPTEGEFRGYVLRSLALGEFHELAERSGWLLKLRTERPAERHILWEGIPHGTHRAPPMAGHGWATARNASNDRWL